MPYKSKSQERYFEACRNNPGSMKGTCPPKTILDEFHNAAKQAGQFKKGKKQNGKG